MDVRDVTWPRDASTKVSGIGAGVTLGSGSDAGSYEGSKSRKCRMPARA